MPTAYVYTIFWVLMIEIVLFLLIIKSIVHTTTMTTALKVCFVQKVAIRPYLKVQDVKIKISDIRSFLVGNCSFRIVKVLVCKSCVGNFLPS